MLSLAGGGTIGYWLHSLRADAAVLSVKDVLQEEYLTAPESFSRVKNTKNTLDALSEQSLAGILDALARYDRLAKGTPVEKQKAEARLQRIIQAGEEAMQEFEGTAQQVDVARGLLLALQKAERFERWTEVYLKTLREYPTHPSLRRLANDAVKVSRRAGQEGRVLAALNQFNAFLAPFDRGLAAVAPLCSGHPCFAQVQTCRSHGVLVGLAAHDLPE